MNQTITKINVAPSRQLVDSGRQDCLSSNIMNRKEALFLLLFKLLLYLQHEEKIK